jgi:hypothetical protein
MFLSFFPVLGWLKKTSSVFFLFFESWSGLPPKITDNYKVGYKQCKEGNFFWILDLIDDWIFNHIQQKYPKSFDFQPRSVSEIQFYKIYDTFWLFKNGNKVGYLTLNVVENPIFLDFFAGFGWISSHQSNPKSKKIFLTNTSFKYTFGIIEYKTGLSKF